MESRTKIVVSLSVVIILAQWFEAAMYPAAARSSSISLITQMEDKEGPTPRSTLLLAPGDQLLISAYQREDLSGKFRIRADGLLSLPLIGKVVGAGKAPAELESELAASVLTATGRAVPISIEVAEWRPISVVGDVEKPGIYSFTPGMTVLHGLAAAGGILRPLREIGPLQLAQQSTTVIELMEQLKLALSERARIISEQAGNKALQKPSRLADLATPEEVTALLDVESAILQDKLESWEAALRLNRKKIQLIQDEMSAYVNQRAEVKRRVALVNAELESYEKLARKGLTRSDRMLQLRSEMAALETTVHSVVAAISKSELSLIEAQEAESSLRLDRQLKLKEQLQKVESEIRRLESLLDLNQRFSVRINSLALTRNRSSHIVKSYEIIRRINNDSIRIPATETVALMPGDVVQVEIAGNARSALD